MKKPFKTTHWLFLLLSIGYGFWIAYGMTSHHYWKDEVRALAIADASVHWTDIFSNIYNDGHPPLWYMFLFLLKSFLPLEYVLPAASWICAMALVGCFLFLSPFHPLIKFIFPFTVYPAFEYSIMSRNYCIAAVPMLIAAYLFYKKIYNQSRTGAFFYFLTLAAMAMSHAISLIFAAFLLLDWFVGDTFFNKGKNRFFFFKLFLQLTLVGIFLWVCLLIKPSNNSMVLHVNTLTPSRILWAIKLSFQNPSASFRRLVTTFDFIFLKIGTFHSVVVGSLFAGLLLYFDRRAKVFFPFYFLAMAVFFKIIYFSDVRHLGLIFFAMIYCTWRSFNPRMILPQLVLFILFLAQIPTAIKLLQENKREVPSNAVLTANFFKTHKPAANAIVMGEPDSSLEEFAVFIPQSVYMHRQKAFRKWLINTSNAQEKYSLRELVDEALKMPQDVYLVFIMGDFRPEPSTISTSYSGLLSWDKREIEYLKKNYRLAQAFTDPKGTNPYWIWEPLVKKRVN